MSTDTTTLSPEAPEAVDDFEVTTLHEESLEPETPPNVIERQLPLFEGSRPTRFVINMSGGVELALGVEKDGDLAETLKLGRDMEVIIRDPADLATTMLFRAKVTKRTFKRIRHKKHGDTTVTYSELSITGQSSEPTS